MKSEEYNRMPFTKTLFESAISRFGLTICLIGMCSTPSLRAQCDFINVAPAQGITHEFRQGLLGSGVSFMDFDGDGWDDLTFGTSEGEIVEIYKNNQGQFEKVMLNGITNACESKQITWIDYDNDGDKDLFYTCVGDNLVLYRNEGNLFFTDVTFDLGLQSPIGSTLGANWADFDRDGWLDLYITIYGQHSVLYRNLGGTGFQNVTLQSNVSPTVKPTFCGVVFDYDNDGWEDIYLANDRSTRNDLFKNLGGMQFQDVSAASQSNLPMDAMGTTLLDMNRDGYFEVYISNSPEGNALLFNNGDGTFTNIAESSGTFYGSVGWGVNTLDFDNDTYQDLYVAGSEIGTEFLSNVLYRATSETSFEQTAYEGMATDTMSSYSNAVGDFNRDGRMDIAVSNSYNTKSQLWQNECTDTHHWLKVKLRGTVSNRDGIGATVIVYAGGQPQYQYMLAGTSFMAQNTDYVHFGMAASTSVDSLFVEWPSGLTDRILNPTIDSKVTVVEGSQVIPVAVRSDSDPATLCEGDPFTLSVDFPHPAAEIIWSNQEMGKEIEASESGTYQAEIRLGNQVYMSEARVVAMIDIPDVSYTVTPVTEVSLGSITIEETGGPYTYRWSHDPSLEGPVATDLSIGSYQVQVSNNGRCVVNLTIAVGGSVVTSLDDPLLAEIIYSVQNSRLSIQLPADLAPRPLETRLLNAQGLELQSIKSVDSNQMIHSGPLPTDQLVIVQMLFTEGKVVKKLIIHD